MSEADIFIDEYLLNKVGLKIGNEIARIAEIEVYQSPDPYIHEFPEQKMMGRWYFHKSGNNNLTPGGFRGGTYKGLDLTCGTSEKAVGILIRSIQINGKIIEGPCKVVDFILKCTQAKNILDLVGKSSEYPPRCDDESFPLHLIILDNTDKTIYAGPRVGLSCHSTEPHLNYLMMNLRFTTIPEQIKKNKCTLVLNFLANNRKSLDLPLDEREIYASMQTFNTNEKTISRWWSEFLVGINLTENLINCKTISGICQAYGKFRN